MGGADGGRRSWDLSGVQSHLPHLQGSFEQIVQTLALDLGLFPRLSPDKQSVSTDQNGRSLGVLSDGCVVC